MPLDLDSLPDKPKRTTQQSQGSLIDFDTLPDKPTSHTSLLNFDMLPDKPTPRKDFMKEILPKGIEAVKSVAENLPIAGGLSYKQIALPIKHRKEIAETYSLMQPAFKWFALGMPEDLEGIKKAETSSWGDLLRESTILKEAPKVYGKNVALGTAMELPAEIGGTLLEWGTDPVAILTAHGIGKGIEKGVPAALKIIQVKNPALYKVLTTELSTNKETLSKAYQTLGVDPGTNEAEINSMFRKQALTHHPDRGGDPGKFADISNAYDTIMGSRQNIISKLVDVYKKAKEDIGPTSAPVTPEIKIPPEEEAMPAQPTGEVTIPKDIKTYEITPGKSTAGDMLIKEVLPAIEQPQPSDIASKEVIQDFSNKNKEAILKDYGSRYGNIISNDNMKKYFSPVGYTGLNSVPYQSEAGKLTKQHFDNLVEENKDSGKYVVFTTGGTGAGKSTAISAYTKDDSVAAIWDLNFTDLEKNSKLIENTLSKGLKVKIAYVLRDPEQAFIDGVVARSINPTSSDYGRAVNVAEHILIHKQVKDVFPKIVKKFGDKIEFEVVDNRGNVGEEKSMTLDDLGKIEYNYKEIGKELESYVRSNAKIPKGLQKSMLRGVSEEGTPRGTQERPAIQERRGQPIQEAGPQEIEQEAPLEKEFSPSSTGAGFPKVSKIPETIPSAQEHVIEMPELVKLTKDLMGKTPIVKGLVSHYGYFKAGKHIALDVDIFKNPHFAGSVLSHEIGHLIDWMPTATLARGNLLGRVLTLRKFMRETFADLSNKEIKSELKALTQWWNPFDEANKLTYTNYRYSAKELYAEALSVLLNQPEKLEQLAPKFYRAFWDNIDKKPEVKEALLDLQNLLNLGEDAKLQIRKEDIQSMFKKGEALFYEERNKYRLAQKDLWFKLKTELIDKNTVILDKIKELERRGIRINPEDNPQYYLEEYNYIGGKIKNLMDNINHEVIKPLLGVGVSMEDFGEYLFLSRVITDRADIANPLGHNRITAEKQLNYMRKMLGEDKFNALKVAGGRFQQVMKELLMRSESSGLIKSDIYGAIVTNPSYATFQVLDYIDDYVSPAIIKQVGTLKEIANPFTSTVIKMVSTLRAIERNETRKSVAKFMQKHFPDEISEAEVRHLGKYKSEIVEKEGYGVIATREYGKMTGYYVDPYIAQTLSYESSVTANGIVSILRFLNSSYFRPVYINLNLGFQTFNLMRDFIRAWKLNPNITFPAMLKKYWDAIPIAKQRVWGDFSNPVISQMQEEGMLSITYNDLLRGMDKEEQSHVDFLLEKYNVIKKTPRQERTLLGRLYNPVLRFLNFIEEVGNFVETLPKVTGYLSRAKSGRNIKEIAHEVRVFSGSPDFFRKGQGYDWYNNVFLFSNAIKEGIRGDIEGGFVNPKTRSGYWWRTAKLNLVPKLVMFLASIGYFGQQIKENFDKQTEYDKTNYITLPLGLSENGKAVYFRIPQDEMGRMFGGMLWKTLNFQKEDVVDSIQDVGSLMAGQVPSLAPSVELVSSWSQYALGKNPYDWFKGRNILSNEEMKAGGWYSLGPMLEWTSGKMGFNIRAKRGDEAPFEFIIRNTPAVQRFLRITDYGELEKEREQKEEYNQFKATRTLEKRAMR